MFRRHAVVRRKVVEVAVSDVHQPVPVVEEVFSPWMRLSPQWPNKSANRLTLPDGNPFGAVEWVFSRQVEAIEPGASVPGQRLGRESFRRLYG